MIYSYEKLDKSKTAKLINFVIVETRFKVLLLVNNYQLKHKILQIIRCKLKCKSKTQR